MKKTVTILTLAAMTLMTASMATAEGTFEIIEGLEASFFGGQLAISDDGMVVGGNWGGLFTWTEADGVTFVDPDFDFTGGYNTISGDGMSLTTAFDNADGLDQAGYWNATDGFVLMDPLDGAGPCGSSLSTAYALNYDGTIGVGLHWIDCDAVAFKWTQGVGTVNLGSSGNSSRATAISSNGVVTVGFDEHPDNGSRRPAIWTDDIAGPQLIGGEDTGGECYNTSTDGLKVTGQNLFGEFVFTAFYYDDIVGMVEVGALPGDEFDGSLGLDVSDNSTVVGQSGNAFFGVLRGFIWTPADGLMVFTDFLIDRGITGWEDYNITSVSAISPDGNTILGTAVDPNVFPPNFPFIVKLGGGVAIENDDTTDPDVAPASLQLHGAYPNPFNPMTAVKFSVTRDQNVRLSVFNMNGRRVAELANTTFARGDHSVNWNGTDLSGRAVPSGTYLIHLESEDGIRSDKMMLVR